MRMLKSNFEFALLIAITALKIDDVHETCFVGGLKEILEASKRGEKITVESGETE